MDRPGVPRLIPARQFDYQAPIATQPTAVQLPRPARSPNGGRTAACHTSRPGQLNQVLQAAGAPNPQRRGHQAKPGEPGIDPVQYLLHHGYMQWTSYQPDSRYWTFQAIEAAWLVVLSILLLAGTVWLVRRRSV